MAISEMLRFRVPC